MPIEVKRLNWKSDRAPYREVASWLDDAPAWLLAGFDAWGVSDPAASFFERAQLPSTVVAVGLAGGSPFGAIVLYETGPARYEVHILARRGARLEAVEALARRVHFGMFSNGCRLVTALVEQHNRMTRRVARRTMFRETGLTVWRGEHRGRPLEWVEYVSTRDDFLRMTVEGGGH